MGVSRDAPEAADNSTKEGVYLRSRRVISIVNQQLPMSRKDGLNESATFDTSEFLIA